MRTRASVCARKRRFATMDGALAHARAATIGLHVYRCDRCCQFHLTSRTKGKFLSGAGRRTLPAPDAPALT